jgi:hypothetical protein
MPPQQNQVQPYQPTLRQNYQVNPGNQQEYQQGQVFQHGPSQYQLQSQPVIANPLTNN